MMYYIVARLAKAHEVTPLVCSATRHRNDVVHLINRSEDAVLKASFAEGMRLNVAVSDAFPHTSVLSMDVRGAAVLLVLSRYQLAVFLTVPSIR